MDLVEFTGQEIALLDKDLNFTLYELSKKYNRDHSKMVRQFESDINKLKPHKQSTLHFGERKITIKTGKNTNQTIKTYSMDIKTAVWFSARFDPSLRVNVVNYAFTKIEDNYKIQQNKVKELETKLKDRPKVVAVNTSNVNRKLRHKELMELVEKGYLEHTTRKVVKHNYEVTELGNEIGYFKEDSVIKYKGE